MYTISQASTMSGVGTTLIRAWERRYGIVTPERTAAGYRLYDERMVATLRAMRALIDRGWQPAQAGRALRDEDVAIEPWLTGAPRPGAHAADKVDRGIADGDLSSSLVRAAAAYDLRGIEAALDEIHARGSFEAVVDDLLLPAAAALGTAWAEGRIDVAAEHLASAAILRRLAASFDAAGAVLPGDPVIVGLPAGSRHELGALAFAVALRRRGVPVLYLGADVPIASWLHAVASDDIRASVVGVVTITDVAAADELLAALVAHRPRLPVALGGAAAATAGPPPGEMPLVLPHRVTDAAQALARHTA